MYDSNNHPPSDTSGIWPAILREAEQARANEPLLENFLKQVVLKHHQFENSLTAVLASRLNCGVLTQTELKQLILEAFSKDNSIIESAKQDLLAFCQRDPACERYSIPFLYYKGYQGLQLYRVGHYLWYNDHQNLALYLQSLVSEVFDMDIHPAARIGKGILIDHATSIVIGETAVVGDNVSMLHEVTLGGTGKITGDRHPKVQSGVLIGAGAKILGNVSIGKNAKIGAGSVVLEDVADYLTVAGVPAKSVGELTHGAPALEMDHSLKHQAMHQDQNENHPDT
jgi:serine O-acetyltransferase